MDTPLAPSTLWDGIVASLVALLFVLALAWLSLRLLRRFSGGRRGRGGAVRTLQVLRAHSLGPRERLVVVRYHGDELLLGVTPGGIQLLDRRAAAPEPPAPSDRSEVGVADPPL